MYLDKKKIVLDWFQTNFKSIKIKLENCSNVYIDNGKPILNNWHNEENVWIHTQMVITEYDSIADNIVGYLACLVHDFGKPETHCERHDKKRVVYYNHATHNDLEAYNVLKQWQNNFKNTELKITDLDINNIMIMKRWHLNIWNVNDNNKKKIFESFSNGIYLSIFLNVCLADSLGRISEKGMEMQQTNLIGNVNMLDVDKYYCMKDYTEILKKNIIMLIGCSGSGKTTFYNTYKKPTTAYISLDKERLYCYKKNNIVYTSIDTFKYVYINKMTDNEIYNNAWEYCNKNKNVLSKRMQSIYNKNYDEVVIDNTNLTTKSRRLTLRSLKNSIDYRMIANVWLPNKELLKARNKNRTDKSISEDVWTRQYNMFQFPDYYMFDIINIK